MFFLWSNGSTDSVATGLVAGNHSLTVTDVYGCPSVFFYYVPSSVATGEVIPWSEVRIFPNPIHQSQSVHIKLPSILATKNLQWQLRDVLGLPSFFQPTAQEQDGYSFSIPTKGIFFLWVSDHSGFLRAWKIVVL